MALFNKLFNTRKNHVQQTNKGENVSGKLFAFSKDQVRVLLFRDFRGRKLLFDSTTVEKVPIKGRTSTSKEFIEVADGFGYRYGKPPTDFSQLAEMVFGSAAMSFRGTYFKIHNLDKPNRFMFTQVSSSPTRNAQHKTASSPNNPEHSTSNVSYSDSSGVNSSNSMASDAVLVCRNATSVDSIDVLVSTNSLDLNSAPSFFSDSGYSAESSLTCSSSVTSLSSSSFSQQCIRRTQTSLYNIAPSLSSLASSSACDPQNRSSSKIGLAFLVQLCPGKEKEMEQFLMEHVSLLEAISWRCRRIVESAYKRTHQFASTMSEMAEFIARFLTNLLSGSYVTVNLWLALSYKNNNNNNHGCDIHSNSISAFSSNAAHGFSTSYACKYANNNNIVLKQSQSECRLLKQTQSECRLFSKLAGCCNGKTVGVDQTARTFLNDFCELVQSVDVKDTNFFMSTLVTAVLTHHLGWVKTCLPSTKPDSSSTSNPLWSQFSELYGACGYPTKLAQTIITGNSRKDLISKILQTLTYFIRCTDIDRRIPSRADAHAENSRVDTICSQNACIPKENYKQYKDHVREIRRLQEDVFVEQNDKKCAILKKADTVQISKASTCLDLQRDLYPQLESVPDNEQLTRKVNTLCRVPSSAILYHTMQNDVSFGQPKDIVVNMEKQQRSADIDSRQNVVFVLGDDEQLVGLKKDDADKTIKRPTFLDLRKEISQFQQDSDMSVKPGTSWSEHEVAAQVAHCSRSQSEPPEPRKVDEIGDKSKSQSYKYSGVKFSLQQHPQILSNYIKSKNLEITNLQFGEKGMKIDELSSISDTITARYPDLNREFEDGCEALQTPSNASELLEFTSDLFVTPPPVAQHAQETSAEVALEKSFVKKHVPNTVVKELDGSSTMKITRLPMPKSTVLGSTFKPIKYSSSLMRAPSDSYMPNMVLQGPIMPKQHFDTDLRTDLTLAGQYPVLNQPVDEAVAIVANIDSWEVQLMSSHTFVYDKTSSTGVRVGMSQMVANMLESLVEMWKLNVHPQSCILYIEQTLQEFCIRSKAVAELLMSTEFCSLEQLTSTLHLEVNDVPLLLAVASTHTPQVTQKYGLSFQ